MENQRSIQKTVSPNWSHLFDTDSMAHLLMGRASESQMVTGKAKAMALVKQKALVKQSESVLQMAMAPVSQMAKVLASATLPA
jgi:hypothetical protein